MRLVIAALLSLLFTAAVAGDYDDGVAAYDRKDYATALEKFRIRAQQGSEVMTMRKPILAKCITREQV